MNVALLIWNEVELLDFAGPSQVFTSAGEGDAFHVYTVAEYARPIISQDFLSINPEYTLNNAPPPDIVVVPGGGVSYITYRSTVLDWLREAAAQAQVVLSVCTGAFVLASAGLLDGLHATTWYAAIDDLRQAAPGTVVHDDRRYVDNGKIITAAGVSAGIDAALYIVSRLQGERVARSAARYMEYRRNSSDTTS